MEKTILKSFATESRNNLIEDVIYRLNLIGITETKINDPISETEGIETFQIGNTTFNLYDKDALYKLKNITIEFEIKFEFSIIHFYNNQCLKVMGQFYNNILI